MGFLVLTISGAMAGAWVCWGACAEAESSEGAAVKVMATPRRPSPSSVTRTTWPFCSVWIALGDLLKGEYDGDLHAAGITIELGMEQDARARNVEGGGDFLGAVGFGLDGADANGRRDQGAAFYTAVLRALVSGRSRGRRSVVALFGDKLFGYRIHFRDNLFVGDIGGAGFLAVRGGRRIV